MYRTEAGRCKRQDSRSHGCCRDIGFGTAGVFKGRKPLFIATVALLAIALQVALMPFAIFLLHNYISAMPKDLGSVKG